MLADYTCLFLSMMFLLRVIVNLVPSVVTPYVAANKDKQMRALKEKCFCYMEGLKRKT